MTRKPKRPSSALEDVLRRAVRDSGLTRYAVAREAGMDVAALLRFMSGERTLTLPSAAKLVAFLGLELRPAKRKVGPVSARRPG